MALVTMVIHCTKQNDRLQYAKKAIESLCLSTDRDRDDIHFVINGGDFIPEIRDYIDSFRSNNRGNITVIVSQENLGTARGINLSWVHRKPGQHAIKIDDDIILDCRKGWINKLEEAVERMARFRELNNDVFPQEVGILGLKRNDCGESMYRSDWGSSRLWEVPHFPGERWLVVEEVKHVMGSCCLYSAKLLDKIGYMYQGKNLYGYDDTLMCSRARAVKLFTGFLLGLDIHHIDPGDTIAAEAKRQSASGEVAQWCVEQSRKYESGVISVYHGPNDD